MLIKSIIIDNTKTKAQRIAADKIQLDLVASPLDEKNYMEPNVELCLYVNGELFQNLKSNATGKVKESLIVDNSDNENIIIELKDVVTGISSRIKNIIIDGDKKEIKEQKMEQNKIEENKKNEVYLKWENLYNLHKNVFTKFKLIDDYFKELIKPKNFYDDAFVNNEFNKISKLADLRYKIKKAKELEFYDIYKDQIEKIILFCEKEMTIFDVEKTINELEQLILHHNWEIDALREEEKIKKTPKEQKIEDNIIEKEKFIAWMKLNPNPLAYLPDRAKNDSDIVKYALEQRGDLLEYVSDNLKNDKKTVMIAMNQNPSAFAYISDTLKTDENFVIECLNKYWKNVINQLSNYVCDTPKVKTWINEYNIKTQQLINKRQNVFSALQELTVLRGNIFRLKSDVIKSQEKLDSFPKLSSLLIQLKQLYQQRHDAFVALNRIDNRSYYSLSKREKQEAENLHIKLKEYEKKRSPILEETEKMPIHINIWNIERATIGVFQNIDWYLSLGSELSANLLSAQQKFNENADKISNIINEMGNIDNKELSRLDEEINK